MNILALDLATNCGWAHNREDSDYAKWNGIEPKIKLGTWHLSSPQEVKLWGKDRTVRRNDPRVQRLFDHLRTFATWADLVVFEDVQFQTYTQQCQLWSSLRAAVWLSFPLHLVECVPVKTLKQFATGSGAATKEAMVRAVIRNGHRFQSCFLERDTFWDTETLTKLDDNAADAYHIFRWAEQNLSRRKVA
jgi:hypothetical protein